MPRSVYTILVGIFFSFGTTLLATWAYFRHPDPSSPWGVVVLVCVLLFSGLMLVAGRAVATINAALTRQVDRNRRLDQRLAASDTAEKRFWSSLSHDLRTPLNSIIGYAELMLDEEPKEANRTFRTDLERIKSAGFDLLVKINELLAVSELKTGASDPHIEATDICNLVNDIAVVLAPLAARQETELRLQLPEEPCVLRTDGIRLEKLLLALVTNAIKSAPGGSIVLQADFDDAKERLQLIVNDSGCVICPDQVATIIEPETPADETSQGPGLGLSFCRYLVEELGGTVSVENRTNQPGVCMISIPAEKEIPAQVDNEQEANIDSTPPNVLVIDENEDAADVLSRHLRRFGCHVTISVDGAFGKDLAVDLQPDLVIMEVDMTSIDGWALLQHLKYDSRTRNIPVVICSSMDMRKRAHELGAADYLLKPVTATSAIASLMQLAGLRSRLTEPSEEACASREHASG